MAIALNSGIEEGHRTMAIQAVAGNPHGADLVLKFIKQNFSTIIRRLIFTASHHFIYTFLLITILALNGSLVFVNNLLVF